jgi:methanogenic corrinoid protein MtbC1
MTATVLSSASLEDASEEFFGTLSRADEHHAVAVALDLLDSGTPAEDILVGLVGGAQQRIGALWQAGEWSVAQEHAATCINERVVAAVGARSRPRTQRGSVVLACLDGEWHALPARIVGEVLRLHGWQVMFLGASVPTAHLVSYLHLHGPDVVAVSCALPAHLPAAHRTITAARRTGTPVLAGGPGFGRQGRWAHRLGVDAYAATAAEAVALLDAQPWPGPATDGAGGPGPEYAGLRERRAHLVPLLAGGAGEVSLDTTAEDDAAQVVDFLAAAVYLDDAELFVSYVGWLREALAARGAPVAALADVLEQLRAELHDFPVAQACLRGGLVLLTDPTPTPTPTRGRCDR